MKEKDFSCFAACWVLGRLEDLPSTEQAGKTKPKQEKSFSLTFHRF